MAESKTLTGLPDELLINITEFLLYPRDLVNMGMVNWRLRDFFWGQHGAELFRCDVRISQIQLVIEAERWRRNLPVRHCARNGRDYDVEPKRNEPPPDLPLLHRAIEYCSDKRLIRTAVTQYAERFPEFLMGLELVRHDGPLTVAVMANRAETLKLLLDLTPGLQEGIWETISDHTLRNLFDLSALYGQEDTALILMDIGASIWTAPKHLCGAAAHGKPQLLLALISAYRSSPWPRSMPPLTDALKIAILAASSFSPDSSWLWTEGLEFSILRPSATVGRPSGKDCNFEIIDMLVAAGADLSMSRGLSVIRAALHANCPQNAARLMDHQIQKGLADPEDLREAIHLAVQNDKLLHYTKAFYPKYCNDSRPHKCTDCIGPDPAGCAIIDAHSLLRAANAAMKEGQETSETCHYLDSIGCLPKLEL
ncbi:hypothetical protein AB5N19_09672 [Seiridium cardinale]